MHEVIGGPLIKHQDHHLVLGPDLPSYHLDAADKEKAMWMRKQDLIMFGRLPIFRL